MTPALVALLLLGHLGGDGSPGAAVPTVEVLPERDSLLLGTETEMQVVVRITGAPEGTAPRVLSNVGTLEALPAQSDGQLRYRFVAPPERFPHVAIVAAEIPRTVGVPAKGRRFVRGAATIRLHASTLVPFRTEPGASVTLTVGGHEFGPQIADRDGRVRIPVTVAPGVGTGLARSRNRYGNTTETEVDLQLPGFGRSLTLAPPDMPAGGTAEVTVFAVDADGAPAKPRAVTLRSSYLPPQPTTIRAGEARFVVHAPESLVFAPLRLLTTVSGTPDWHAETKIELRPGPAFKLDLRVKPDRLVVASGGRARVTATASDAFGNPTSAAGAFTAVNGEPVEAEVLFDGRLALDVVAPERNEGGDDDLVVEVAVAGAAASKPVRLVGGPPARVEMAVEPPSVEADGRTPIAVRARVFDRHGTRTEAGSLTGRAAGGTWGAFEPAGPGTYVARFVPDVTTHAVDTELAIDAGPGLRQTASVHLEPPAHRLALTPRAGYHHNLGKLAGPAVALDATAHIPGLPSPLRSGLQLGYTRSQGDVVPNEADAKLAVDVGLLLGTARYHVRTSPATEASLGAGAGVAFARAAFSVAGIDRRATGTVLLLQLAADLAYAMGPGQGVLGLRYQHAELGALNHAETLRGNLLGLGLDVGYRFGW